MRDSVLRIVRSRRRTVGLRVTEQADLVIHAPRWVTVSAIKKIVQEKQRWIERTRDRILQRNAASARHFAEGSLFPFQGHDYPLRISAERAGQVTFDDGFIVSGGSEKEIRAALIGWYRSQADQIIPERAAALSAMFKILAASFKVSAAKSRWGSCSSRNTIRINWRLILTPPEVLDYVICHELAHVREKNHSKKFWNEVAVMMPDFEQRRQWLRMNDHLLRF